MGLLDDPSQLAAIVGLLQGRQPAGGLLMQYADSIEQRKRAAQQEQMQKLQQEHMQMQMAQQKEMMARQQQEQALAGQFARPGMPERPQMGPTPDGSPMPMAPAQAPGFDYQGYAGALAGVDPMKSLALQSQLAGMGQKESFTLKPGERRYQGDKVVAEGGPESVKPGTLKEVKSGGNIITYEWNGSKWEKIATAPQFKPDGPEKPDKPPQGYRFDQAGNLQFIPGGPADPRAGKTTDTERTAAGYLQRMTSAEAAMKPLEADFGKPGVREALLTRGGGATGEMVANALPQIMGGRSPERQQYRQAQEDWVRAKLRKESGAVIADAEMAREISTYFPQLGDSPQVIAQKAKARQVAMQAMQIGAGPVSTQTPASNGWTVKRVD